LLGHLVLTLIMEAIPIWHALAMSNHLGIIRETFPS
jgi:hypothetical protein